MPVRIADRDPAGEAELVAGHRNRAALTQLLERRAVAGHEPRLPMDEIVRALAGRERSTASGSEVLEELYAVGGAQARDPQVGATDGVQALLLGPGVLAAAGDPEAEAVTVEGETLPRIPDRDRGVIDAEEEPVGRLLPARIPLARREPDELERMTVGIAEVERPDASGVRI